MPGFGTAFIIMTLTLVSASLIGVRIFNRDLISTAASFAMLAHTVCFAL